MNEDDASLAAFLDREADKPPLAPYRAYVSTVLLSTAEALEHGWPAHQLEAELAYAFALLQDAMAPIDPTSFRDGLAALVDSADGDADRLKQRVEDLFEGM